MAAELAASGVALSSTELVSYIICSEAVAIWPDHDNFFLLKSWAPQNFITIETSWNTND
jgi:hypothetical protein